jgi:hypothetical protein
MPLWGLIVALLALGIWLIIRMADEPAPAPEPARPPPVVVLPAEQVVRVELPGESQRQEGGQAAPWVPSFEGRGRIRGSVATTPGVVMPRQWELIVEPHPFLVGSERAERRQQSFAEGERAFTVEDLPLGGYIVRVVAEGMNSQSCDVLLVRGAEDQFVQPQFSMAGLLEGSVLDAQDLPAEGLEARLSDARTGKLWYYTSGADGRIVFRDLPDGEYELGLYGSAKNWIAGRSLVFSAPRMSLDPIRLPESTSLKVQVVDMLGRPASKVRLIGFGKPRGQIDAPCDERGECLLRWLEPGTYRISVRDEVENLSARGDVILEAGRPGELLLRLASQER